MIVLLEGRFIDSKPDSVCVKVGGVGYHVSISRVTYLLIQDAPSGELFIYHDIREDSQRLYGFWDSDERDFFVQLIGVAGVGGSTALSMLSGMDVVEIRGLIVAGDDKGLSKIKGIGPKTAKQIILVLKDKLEKEGVAPAAAEDHALSTEAVSGLVTLGYSRSLAQKAVKSVLEVADDIDVETLIRLALKSLI